jgi:very-short-patch-repair endonuclease
LGKALALQCLYCRYDEGEWVAAGRQLPWESELKLMRELVGAQLSEEWCCQAAPGFWPAAVDFVHTSQKAIMQADGSGHFKDTFDVSCKSVLEQDMSCCVKAVEASVSVIRVHDLQLQRGLRNGCLAAACKLATSCLCVVLSPAYHTVCIYEAGRMVTYADMLASRLPEARVVHVPWGIVILCKK